MNIFLYILSLIYGVGIWLRRVFYRVVFFHIHRVDCKVISVGNVTVGGTGKTTLTEFLAKLLKGKGRGIAILSRGSASCLLYHKPCIDEPQMLIKNLSGIPVLIGRNRIKNAKLALKKYKADVLILDDGFQYRRLYRDLDIVAIDSTNPFGNGRLLPCGVLREGLDSLKRAGILFLTKVDFANDIKYIKERISCINPDALLVESIHKPTGLWDPLKPDNIADVSTLKDKKVLLISSIGDPASFEKMVAREGIKILRHLGYPDHYHYKDRDLKYLIDVYKENNADAVITTQKDWVKLVDMCEMASKVWKALTIFVLKIELKITSNEEEFLKRLNSVFCS